MDIWLTISASLFSGLVGVGVSTFYFQRYENRKMKFDLIRRLAGTRYQIAGDGALGCSDGFFVALNEIFVAFHDEPKVIEAVERLRRDLGRPRNIDDNLPLLFKELFRTVGLKNEFLSDSFILTPFTPPKK